MAVALDSLQLAVCDSDPSMMTEMMKGNITNVLPMIIIGGWINWAFSGFLTSELHLLVLAISCLQSSVYT